MQPIDPSKLSAEISKSDAEVSKEISNKLASAVTDKQRLAIGLLLKQTLQQMSENGLLSVDTQKAVISARKILPGEFTQLYIQDRIKQHKVAETLSNQLLKPPLLTTETTRQWFSGQIIPSIVYQPASNGLASLLLSKSGQFSSKVLSQIPVQPLTPASEKALAKLFANDLLKQSQRVNIKTDLPLQTGQQLLLQINKSAGEISFQLNHSPRESHFVSQYLNQFAAKQQALPQLLASLQQIATQGSESSRFFTPKFQQQVDKVLQQFPPLSQLSTATDIRTGLQNSGLFLENKILNASLSSQVLSSDLKVALSQLIALIKHNEAILLPKQMSGESHLYQTIAHETNITNLLKSVPLFDLPGRVLHAQVQPPVTDFNLLQLNNPVLLQNRILDQLEGVLSRIMFTQLQSREGGEQQMLNFEIPFRHNDQQEILQLKIRQEFKEHEAEKGNKIWTVNLAFHLPSLGGIRIYITMDKQDLAIQFWTEEKSSQKLFQQFFHLLNERLQAGGFTVSQLNVFHGMPESAEQEQKSNQFIIDERV